MKEIIRKAVIEILNLRVLYIAYIVSGESNVIFSQVKGINIEGSAINKFSVHLLITLYVSTVMV